MAERHTVVIEKQYEALIPAFMESRRKDLEALRAALASGDFEGLRLIGDRIEGVAGSYGFIRIAAIARLIEQGAKQRNRPALHTLLERYAHEIASVRVAFEQADS